MIRVVIFYSLIFFVIITSKKTRLITSCSLYFIVSDKMRVDYRSAHNEASTHYQVQQDDDALEFLPGPAYVDVVSWHHAGEQSCAAFRHLDVVGRCGDLQIRWTVKPEWDGDFKPLTQSTVVTLRPSDLCWWISEITTTMEVCWIHSGHALFVCLMWC